MRLSDPPLASIPFDLDHVDSLALLTHQTSVLERISAGAPLVDVLTCVVAALEDLIDGSRCSILLLDPVEETLRLGAAPSLHPDYSAQIDGLKIGAEAGSCGSAAYLGMPVIARDIRVDARWAQFRGLAEPFGLRSCWSSPIVGQTGTLGTFAVYHDEPHDPPEREKRLVARFTHLASIAIDHARLFGELAESEERFRRAFEDNAVGMALVRADGRIARVNHALRTTFGFDESQLVGRVFDDLVVPGPRAGSRLQELWQGGDGSVHYEATGRNARGRSIDLAVAASTVHGADGSPVYLSVNLIDITQRNAAERERRARREAEVGRAAAESASQAKSEFVATLNHELRTPLQAILGFTELLRTIDLSPQRQELALEHIGTAASHVLLMVDDLLDISRIEADALALDMEMLELRALHGEVLAILGPLAADHDVEMRAEGAECWVVADRRRLRQVLINVVGNAIRYNRPGGWVTVTTSLADGGATAVTTVRDSGRGIPSDMLHRLFTPFDRLGADPTEPGAGLGLVVARSLTEAMAGRVAVHSAPGIGTTFELRLPRVEGEAP